MILICKNRLVVREGGLEPPKAFAIGTSKDSVDRVPVLPQIDEFRKFLLVDQRKTPNTAYHHCREMKHFFGWLGEKPVSVDAIRTYLGTRFEGKSQETYKNCLSALKVYFRDFMGLGWLVQSFRFPQKQLSIPNVPTREEVQKFYSALEDTREKAMFMLYATTGLRRNELLYLKKEDVDFPKRMIIPRKSSRTKNTWVTFYNEEAEAVLREYLETRKDGNPKLFPIGRATFKANWKITKEKSGTHITPQRLRDWFCDTLGHLNVPDRYVDAFCGRVPRSILARHYSDFKPESLKEIYNKADLKVFG